MTHPDQKTIVIDNAYEKNNICINLQKDTDASNLEVKTFVKLIMNQWEEKEEEQKRFWIQVMLATI